MPVYDRQPVDVLIGEDLNRNQPPDIGLRGLLNRCASIHKRFLSLRLRR